MRLIRWAGTLLFLLLSLTTFTIAQSVPYTVQLEAAQTQTEADQKVAQLKAKGIEAYILKSVVAKKGTFYRIRVGMFPNANEARKFGASLKQQGLVPDFFIAPFERATEEVASTPKNYSRSASTTNVQLPAGASTAKEAAKPTIKTDPPTKIAPAESTVAPPSTINFARFQDPQSGFSFEYPNYWNGNSLSADDAKSQRINAGALFKSSEDAAFLNAIWNELDKANSPTNDNDLIVDVILKSMKSGDGTQTMEEVGRKVIEDKEKAQFKTFLDLRATFQTPGQETPLEFLGKAVIIRAGKGILLVATFYSKNSSANVGGIAEKIIASVKAPE
ncbi:MAG TPA: SPOR domain-containing protein [Blastocatellia bacterium]|nr:SPOR domain-containing protein [Blastocatellia bacterium]HMV87569.1 SPOR domain-containing protein [Blastocatellia bacterium]HMX25876.1 SPOR domain-containing protein [Blastocatellia bacterium]HMY72901.1 SPOR domain-containing protein [Blastocatellia bacterium]HMZ21856.1 SPOR domain-containing protein [Blastocatellia bacterium]